MYPHLDKVKIFYYSNFKKKKQISIFELRDNNLNHIFVLSSALLNNIVTHLKYIIKAFVESFSNKYFTNKIKQFIMFRT